MSPGVTVLQKYLAEQTSAKTMLAIVKKKLDSHPAKPLDVIDAGHYIKEVAGYWETASQIHAKILTCGLTTEETEEANTEFEDIFDLFTYTKCGLQRLQATMSPPVSTASSSTSGSIPRSEVRLPKITLPKFAGDVSEWISFRDMFMTTIHNSTTLSDAQKFTYLQSSLVGNAAKIVKSFEITDVNYSIAWDNVMKRYENERELYFSIMRKFISKSSVSSESPSSLRSLVDSTNECIRAIGSLSVADKWDAILVFLIAQKLDPTSRQFWELTLSDTSIPTSKSLIDFIEQRARSLTASGTKPQPTLSEPAQKRPHAFHIQAEKHFKPSCKICNESHPHFKCDTLLNLDVPSRIRKVQESGLCPNCLRSGHDVTSCQSRGSCMKCQRKHHSILHRDPSNVQVNLAHVNSTPKKSTNSIHPSSISSRSSVSTHAARPVQSLSQPTLAKETILATAIVLAKGKLDNWIPLRSLIDGGATASFITTRAMNRLGISARRVSAEIKGFGSKPSGVSNFICEVTFQSRFPKKEQFHLPMYVMDKLTDNIPSAFQSLDSWTHIRNLQLADPKFNQPAEIDILLGADISYYLLSGKVRKKGQHCPVAVHSKLGWIISGTSSAPSNHVQVNCVATRIDESIQKFWELESVPAQRVLTKEEKFCESHFQRHHAREPTGRYVVKIPMKDPIIPLGSSREAAVRRLLQVERRLLPKPKIYEAYVEFMRQYEFLGHMTRIIGPAHANLPKCNFLPHHFVVKDEDTLNKFRVVFDASAKTSSGFSFNEAQHVGPTIQDTLYAILLRFRIHPVGFTADIGKMYRQVLVHPEQRHLQCIVWRESPKYPVQEYMLNTVTYGTAAAPFLATRTLQQLAKDEEATYPLASTIVKRDFYVDDCISGADTPELAKQTVNQLRGLCSSAHMSLRKFSSNCPSILKDIPDELKETQFILSLDEESELVKALGLHWNTKTDEFLFRVTLPSETEKITKRILLSQISTLFDPMGWLAPTIIKTKLMMQSLWKEKIGWDDPVPSHLADNWLKLRSNLSKLENLRIPRCTQPAHTTSVEIHGFCDASEVAYAAVIYSRSIAKDGSIVIRNLTSKTKVAPVKTVSLPRLELCGAHLLANLMEVVQDSLPIKVSALHAWTDSTVVLGWLRSSPQRWKTFVANRVSQILESIPSNSWAHVKGTENPADCATRGLDPLDLIHHELWWDGPPWLQRQDLLPNHLVPMDPHDTIQMASEAKAAIVALPAHVEVSLFSRFSNLLKLKRVTAYCIRFIRNCRMRISKGRQQHGAKYPTQSSSDSRTNDILMYAFKPGHSPSSSVSAHNPLTTEELETAFLHWIRKVQQDSFKNEYYNLSMSRPLHPASKILPLTPFLDNDRILRVGGRLRHAKIHSDQRTPILLPRHHRLTELIILEEHIRNLHAGPQLVLSILSQKFWIIRARDAVRHQIQKCHKCIRYRAKTQTQQMGHLPAARVNPSRPFTSTGVDYAGPFTLRAIPAKSKVTFKGYLALFVCFSTRAIHLEAVSSLSTEAFLATLKRFISRRGRPAEIYSDCGTNFVGAQNQMTEFRTLLASSIHNQKVSDTLSSEGIKWIFNPPHAPHFGGLWEAGVKSVKHHLTRVVGPARLTFEELSTIFTQVEACLNSRPITPLSTDPNDLSALTPGHFLTGDSLKAISEPDYTNIKENRLKRWQRIQQMYQHFWKRWSQEYLSRLQQRPKWFSQRRQIRVGDLVLIKHDELSPTKWPLARVLKIHPGDDGLVRSVLLHTSTGELKRPIVKLCLLPVDQDDTAPPKLVPDPKSGQDL